MKRQQVIIAVAMCASFVLPGFGQERISGFIPAVFWNIQADKGVILSSPNELIPIDSRGIKSTKISVTEAVLFVDVSPDGKKIVYTTATGLWIIKDGSPESVRVFSGVCDSLRWNKDSLGFTFATYEKKEGGSAEGYGIKLFWADGDGKNLKQVYP